MKFDSPMTKDLKITLVQASLTWEAPHTNLKHLGELINSIRKNSTHLILLPEMFSTGFTMNAEKVAHSMKGEEVAWMLNFAKQKNAVICGSLVISEKGKYYNRLIWAQPDGKVLHYDKRHLFRMAEEHKTYSSGQKKLIVTLQGWKICPLVCYDLRFPVWSRTKGEVDLMFYVANWPERRSYPWKQLLIARAIENQCFVAGLNRVGDDGKEIAYVGDSVALDPLGMPVSDIPLKKESVTTITLSKKQLLDLRKSFPVMKDNDNFKIL